MPLFNLTPRDNGVIGLVAGIIFVLFSFYTFWDTTSFLLVAVRAEGIVVSTKYWEGHRYPNKSLVKFKALNSQEFTHWLGSDKFYAIGEPYPILYNPNNPQEVRPIDFADYYYGTAEMFVLASCMIFFGWRRIKKYS